MTLAVNSRTSGCGLLREDVLTSEVRRCPFENVVLYLQLLIAAAQLGELFLFRTGQAVVGDSFVGVGPPQSILRA